MTHFAHPYPRGKYPSRVLAKIRSKSLIDYTVGYVYVHLFVAAAFNAMVLEIRRETGKTIYASGPAGGYRSLSLEAWMHTHYRWLWPVLAAVGFSNHNEADCIDVYSWEGLSVAYVNAKLRKFGFTRPITTESWHLQHDRSDRWYVPKSTTPTDTRKVFCIPQHVEVVNGKKTTVPTRYYLAGVVGGKSYISNTRIKLIRDRWVRVYGKGNPFNQTLTQIRAKAGLPEIVQAT